MYVFCCTFALVFFADLILALTPLPAHGEFASGASVENKKQYQVWQDNGLIQKKFKLNPPHVAGLVNDELLRCPNCEDPFMVNVTVYDYRPFVQVDIKLRRPPVDKVKHDEKEKSPYKIVAWRTAPIEGVMYGLVQIWCPFSIVRSSYKEDDTIHDLTPLTVEKPKPKRHIRRHRLAVLKAKAIQKYIKNK